MKRALKILSLADSAFLILLMVSGAFTGVASRIVYFLAFLIPFAIGFYYSRELKTEREEQRGLYEPVDSYFCLDKRKARDFLPIIAPAVADIFLLAALTALLLSSLGFTNSQPENTGILSMLVLHALCPAILEEMLFRYIPMKLIAPYSRRWCVIFSSVFFALAHANLFQIPYAFAAGVVFMCVNLALDSVWPSIILHLFNNAASVVWMKYCADTASMVIFAAILFGLAAVSWLFIIPRRRLYKDYICSALDEGRPEFDARSPIAFAVISLYVAFSSLFS